MFTRKLGRSELEVSALGMGCWAIGGPFWHDGWVGYGTVDDRESVAAVRGAMEMGVNFFDTADAYGCGHSECILGQAIGSHRDEVVIATKFGNVIDEEKRRILGEDASPDYLRRACEASLSRLGTDRIDLYQFHLHDYDIEKALEVRHTLEDLVAEGKILWYGWSLANGQVEQARLFAQGEHCTAIQHTLHVFVDEEPILDICDRHDLASINQGPLGRGLLTGKFDAGTQFAENDMRNRWGWDFSQGPLAERVQLLESIKEILTEDGRTLAQAALGWVWARHPRTIPIPGFKNLQQVKENAAALKFGPLSAEQMQAIDLLLQRHAA